MKSAVVKASELGTNCWMPLRFLNSCHKCPRYWYCKYPERVVNKEYDETAKSMIIAYREYKRLAYKLKNI